MAITQVQNNSARVANGTSLDIVFDSAVTSGNSIVVAIGHSFSAATSVTDNNSNTYTQDQINIATRVAELYHSSNVASGVTTVTVTAGSASAIGATIFEYDKNITLDVAGQAEQTTGTIHPCGNITTTVEDTVIITSSRNFNAYAGTPAPGFTEITEDLREYVQERISTVIETVGSAWTSAADSDVTSVIAAYKEVISPGGLIQYVEDFQTWTPSSKDTWEEKDLSEFVPSGQPDITAEILIGVSGNVDLDYFVGVRTPGSTLDRRINLYFARFAGGYNSTTMHVQLSGGKIEHYAPSGVDFFLMGYWAGTKYVELATSFSGSTPTSTWNNVNLDTFGATSGSIVEIIAVGSFGNIQGLRSVGNTDDRKYRMNWGDNFPDPDNYACWTSSLQTSGINATIQSWAEFANNDFQQFYLMGYWEEPPGDYTDVYQDDEANPSADNTWESIALSGVPPDAVASLLHGHNDNTNSIIQGSRELYSSLERKLNQTQTGGSIYRTAQCWQTTVGSGIETYSEDAVGSLDHFVLLGYWDNFKSIPSISAYNAPLIILGYESRNTLQEPQYPSGLTLFIDVLPGYPSPLFISGPSFSSSSVSLFIAAPTIVGTSGGLAPGIQIVGDSPSLFMSSPTLSSGNSNLFLKTFEFLESSGNAALFIHGVSAISGSTNCFIKAPESMVSSGNFFVKGPEFIVSSGTFTYPGNINDFAYPFGDQSPDFNIYGSESINDSFGLWIGPLRSRDNWTLYLKTEDNDINNTANLFTQGFIIASGESGVTQTFNKVPFYLEAINADFPYTAGGTEAWTLFLKTQSGNPTSDEAWIMFLKADTTIPAICNLYTFGHASGSSPRGNLFSKSVNFVCSIDPDDPSRIGFTPNDSHSDPWNLFLKVDPGYFGKSNLYMSGAAPVNYSSSGNLFIEGLFGQESGTVLFYLMGVSGLFNNGPGGLNLFLDAGNQVYNTRGNLYVHGY